MSCVARLDKLANRRLWDVFMTNNRMETSSLLPEIIESKPGLNYLHKVSKSLALANFIKSTLAGSSQSNASLQDTICRIDC